MAPAAPPLEARLSHGTSRTAGQACPRPQEDLLVLVLESEVEGLRGEVADDVGQVAPPEGQHALLLGDTHNAVHDALVLLVGRDSLARVLHLGAAEETQAPTRGPGHTET